MEHEPKQPDTSPGAELSEKLSHKLLEIIKGGTLEQEIDEATGHDPDLAV